MSTFAVISDIHANLEALDAVLADVARRGIGTVYCLGDVLGYGPNPLECLDRAAEWELTLLGNHDIAAMFDPDGFSDSAARAIFWHRARLESTHEPCADRERRWNFLAERPRSYREGDFLFVHGSPRNPLNEYLFPEDIYNARKMTRIGELIDRYCFCGHTHVPGVFVQTEGGPGAWEFFAPAEVHDFWRFDGRKAVINAGSVGQPRDEDWRACYVTVEGWDVCWHRVPYDVNATVAKIYAVPELDNFLGDRLREGR